MVRPFCAIRALALAAQRGFPEVPLLLDAWEDPSREPRRLCPLPLAAARPEGHGLGARAVDEAANRYLRAYPRLAIARCLRHLERGEAAHRPR
jgi:hypothetical protein